MTFSLVQAGPIGTNATSTVTCTLTTPSTAGTLLVAGVVSAAGGTPFTAPAGWVQAAASGGSSILLGANGKYFAQVSAAVTGVSTAILYNPASAGTGGVPATWPGVGSFPAGVTTQIVDFAPDVQKVLSGSLDNQLTAFFSGAPNGSWLMPYHEVNGGANIKKYGYTAAQINQLDNYLLALKNKVNPALVYARGFATSAVRGGQNLAPWVTPGMDAYGMDGYQTVGGSGGQTPDTIFGGTLSAIRAKEKTTPVAIIETMTHVSGGFAAWANAIYSYVTSNDNFAIVQFFFGTEAQTQPWSSSFKTALQNVSSELASAGSADDAEIWYYPANPGGISSAVFSNAAGAGCRGSMSEFSTTGASQVLDVVPGAGGGPGPATSFPLATVASSAAGDLGVAVFGDKFTVAPAGSFTTPPGWTALRSQGTVQQAWASYYQAGLGSGAQSVTGAYSVSTNQTSWGGVLAVFRDVAALAVTSAGGQPAATPGKAYEDTLTAAGGTDTFASWAIASGSLPVGLSLDTATGIISGTPVTTGTSTFTVTVTDSGGATATSGSLSITVSGSVFPGTPLGLACELDVGGWTDITADAVQPGTPAAAVTITRGRPDETTTQATPDTAAFQLNNRSGDYTARNPAGPYYGLLGRNTPVRWSVPADTPYLRLEEDASSQAAAPSTAGLNITGDIDVRIDMNLSSYMPGLIAGKGTAWTLSLNGDGTLSFGWVNNATSTQPLPNLGRIAVRATLAVATGTVTFYTAPTMSGTWTQLGAAVVAGGASIVSSTSTVSVGNWSPELGTSGQGVTGAFYEFRVYSGIGGTLEADPLFTGQSAGVPSFTDGQGNTWSLFGTAEISTQDFRYHGELAALPVTWDPTGSDVWAPVTAAGPLRRLGQGSSGAGTAGGSPIQSAIRRAILAQQGDLFPEAYWPMEDASSATSLGSATGAPAATFTTGLQLAADSNFACSAPIPTLGGSEIDGTVPPYPGGTGAMIFRFLLDVPSGESVSDGTPIMRVLCTRTVREFTLRYKTGGALDLSGWDSNGNNLFDTGPVSFAVQGKQLWVSMELRQSGSHVDWSVATLQPGASTGLGTSGSITGTVGNCLGWQANPANRITDMGVGHIQVQSAWASLFSLYQPLNAWDGETAGNRFARLCSENGLTARVYGFPDITETLGYQPVDTLGNILQQCEDADRGQIYEPRQVLGLAYRTCASLCNQAPAVAFDYSQDHLSPPLLPVDDDLLTVNDVTASSTTGSSVRLTLDDGSPMSISPPPAGAGDYAATVSVNTAADSQLPDVAGWVLHVGTTPAERYPSVVIDLASSGAALASIAPDVRAADIGDYLTIVNQPGFLPPGTIGLLQWGSTEVLGDFVRNMTWNCVPAGPYSTALCDDPVYGRADTDGSQLDSDIGTTDTTMVADITGPSGIGWTTDSSDWPFDIIMGGEQITVTAVGQANFLQGDDATFDTTDGNWTAAGNSTIAQTTAKHHTGTGSLQMTASSSGTMDAASVLAANIITGGLQVSPGDQVQVSAWYLTAVTARFVAIAADFYDATGSALGTVYADNPGWADNTSTWTQASGVVTAPSGAAYARLRTEVEAAAASEVHYVDDCLIADLSALSQQFTVTRSVNGVVKAHSAGEDIRLAHPAILAMN